MCILHVIAVINPFIFKDTFLTYPDLTNVLIVILSCELAKTTGQVNSGNRIRTISLLFVEQAIKVLRV